MVVLTEEMIIARAKNANLSQIKKLNCWGSELTDISILHRMPDLEILALSVNNISNLKPFVTLKKLEELYLRKNLITDPREVAHLQVLPNLKSLTLEDNPICSKSNYRETILQILPRLKKLDDREVKPEEVESALQNYASNYAEEDAGDGDAQEYQEEEEYEEPTPMRQRSAPMQRQQSLPQSQSQSQPQQTQAQPQTQQQYRRSQYTNRTSPSPPQQDQTTHSSSPTYESKGARETAAYQQQTQNNDAYYQGNYQAAYPANYEHRSPGSEHDATPYVNYAQTAEQAPIPPSISTHSMKEYYQSDRPTSNRLRHSQNDLTEWEGEYAHAAPRRGSAYIYNNSQDRPPVVNERYAYRNGSAHENGGDWEENERPRYRRFHESSSNVSTVMMNHCVNCHRRPVNRNSNILSAVLCLLKELDGASLEVVEHECRIMKQ